MNGVIYENFLNEFGNNFLNKSVDKTKDRINVKPVDKRFDKNHNDEVIDTKSNYNDGKINLPQTFVNSLIMYIDDFFPNETNIGINVSVELGKIIRRTGKDFEKVKKQIRNIILKEKIKMLDRINTRCSSIIFNSK